MHLVDPPHTCTFTTQELARLGAYRAAVAAGFYTDWDGSATRPDRRLLPKLLGSALTRQERQRLVQLRRAVAAERRSFAAQE